MASKQQEVEILENWEDIDSNDVLDKKIETIISPTQRPINTKSNGMKAPFKIILTGDDALRSQYVPPEPTVKILKRPSKDTQQIQNDTRILQPKKTLQQREQEYAEARLRILGEMEKTDETVSIVQSRPKNTELENVIRLPKGPDGTKGFNHRR